MSRKSGRDGALSRRIETLLAESINLGCRDPGPPVRHHRAHLPGSDEILQGGVPVDAQASGCFAKAEKAVRRARTPFRSDLLKAFAEVVRSAKQKCNRQFRQRGRRDSAARVHRLLPTLVSNERASRWQWEKQLGHTKNISS